MCGKGRCRETWSEKGQRKPIHQSLPLPDALLYYILIGLVNYHMPFSSWKLRATLAAPLDKRANGKRGTTPKIFFRAWQRLFERMSDIFRMLDFLFYEWPRKCWEVRRTVPPLSATPLLCKWQRLRWMKVRVGIVVLMFRHMAPFTCSAFAYPYLKAIRIGLSLPKALPFVAFIRFQSVAGARPSPQDASYMLHELLEALVALWAGLPGWGSLPANSVG